jgi:DNA-binding SARP family transcriptional activator/tetratricopeptide (TPR) repeat protein
MRFDVLGPLRVHHGAEVSAVAGVLRRTLLAVLLANANKPVSADVLRDALWGRDDEDAARRLHIQVHRLRATLDDPDRLSFDAAGYRLRVAPGELDAERFGTLLDDAAATAARDPRRTAELARAALDLWRDTPYHGTDVPALAGEAQRLGERRLVAVEMLYTAEIDSGRSAAVVGEIADAVARHPLRERLHALLMTALYQSGRQAEALAAYQHARTVLVDELGLEPGSELRDLEQRILHGTPLDTAVPPAPRAVPAQLPHTTAGFVGRRAELSTLDDLLDEPDAETRVATVVGTAGVGKTSLVVRWAHAVRDRFPDGQLYCDLRGYGPDQPLSPEQVLATFLRALGMDGTAVPQDPAERASRFRTLADGRRLLIVLDNAHSAEQVRPLLPGTARCLVVVTSRNSLAGLVVRDGARRIVLGRLTPAEADDLLASLLGGQRDAEREAAARLADRCARLPLALRIAAERLRDRPGYRITDLLAELTDERGRLDLLDSGDRHTSVRAVFAASYRHLDDDAARLFRLFGVHPGHDVDLDALATLADADPHATRRLLDSLVRANLVEESAPSRYALHDLLWTYAAELAQATDPPAARNAARTRLLDHYLSIAWRAADLVYPHEFALSGVDTEGPELADYDAAMRWLDTEHGNLLRAAELAPSWNLASYTTNLSAALVFYIDITGRMDEGWQLHSTALAVARRNGDRVAEALALRGLGLVDFRRQRYPEAATTLEAALALQNADEDRTGVGLTLNCLGVIYGLLGRTDDAVDHLRQAIARFDEIGNRGLALRAYTSLGLLHRRHREYEPALRALHEALTVAEETDHPVGHAHAAYGLAGVYRDVKRYPEALRFARQALDLARQARFRLLEGLVLLRLASVHMRLDETGAAQRHRDEALSLARVIGNAQLEAMALNATADGHAAADAPATAAAWYRAALTAAADLGQDHEQARAHAGLGDAYERLGQRDEAIEHWQQALTRYRDLDSPATDAMVARLEQAT